jgi:hypothetical protein
MGRIILLIALVAVGCDAYFQQGFYTRSAVEQIDLGLKRLTAAATTQELAPLPPPAELRAPEPRPSEPRPSTAP